MAKDKAEFALFFEHSLYIRKGDVRKKNMQMIEYSKRYLLFLLKSNFLVVSFNGTV